MSDTITEHAIQIQIADYLAHKPIKWWRNNVGMATYKGKRVRYGLVGSSDFIGFWTSGPHRGKFIALEIKKPETRNVFRRGQREFIDAVRAAGGFAGVATCIADVDRILGGC
jgi:hypothetical protein